MANLVLIAKALEVSKYTDRHIRMLLKQNKVKGEKQGGVWLVDLDSLKEYESQMEKQGSQKFDPTKNK
jgi:hypothetical protein